MTVFLECSQEFAMDHVKSEGKEREADDLKSKTELSGNV